jgi:FlaA1/EpsC-like NDP-sugar epimerase
LTEAGLLVSTFRENIYPLLGRFRRTVALLTYALVAAGALGMAFLLRFEFAIPPEFVSTMLLTLPLLVVARLVCAVAFNLSIGRWRYVGTQDVLQLLAATLTGTLLFAAAAWSLPIDPPLPRSVLFMEWVFSTYAVAGVWFAYRVGYERWRSFAANHPHMGRRVLIIGAGEAGCLLAREMLRSPGGYRPVGFLDDNPNTWGVRLHGIPVLGGAAELERLARQHRADEIVIAIPSAEPEQLQQLVQVCVNTELPFKVLPPLPTVMGGRVDVNQLREVRIEDLLCRAPVQLELPEIAEDLRDTSVLITGAAGSIGSELSRQVALHMPGMLVLLDQSETELYYLELELRARHPELVIAAVVGDVTDPATIEHVFSMYRPMRVFHAAAYKHVPMMEANRREAIRNNVIGTWRVAAAAGRHGAERFVLVSTDKAVTPVNIMGATKRIAELIILELQEQHPATVFAGVRFGNVLGSNGSVLPLFRRQLAEGKPLTVTDPEATRYFMTIPEAVQLILQASLLPEVRGHIAMLEMGEPVRILDLARNLLRLSGRGGRDDTNIVFTGLRPGERLHEELVAPDERTAATPIPKVRIVLTPPDARVCGLLVNWERALGTGQEWLVLTALSSLFPRLPEMTQPFPLGAEQAARTEGA